MTIEEQPQDFGSARRQPQIPEIGRGSFYIQKAGLVVTDLTDDLSDALGFDDSVKGALIVRLDRTGLAAQAGLRAGMVIVKVNKKATPTAKAAKEAFAAGSTVKGLAVEAQSQRGGTRTFVLKEDDD